MISLHKSEKQRNMYRRHWIAVASDIVIFAFIFVLMVFLVYFSMDALPQIEMLVLLVGVVLFHILLLAFIVSFTDYWLDSWIVTSERIIDIEQKGLFNREHAEFKLYRIQDVTVDVRGIFATFLDYGDVHIQTAGIGREFVFKQVPHPHKIKSEILTIAEKHHKKKRARYNLEHASEQRSHYSV